MLDEPIDGVITKLNRFPWGKAENITSEADRLAQSHAQRMQAVVASAKARNMSPNEAYAEAQSAGFNAVGYDEFMDRLFQDVNLVGVPFREHVILAIASYYFWEDDPQLGRLDNPWVSVMQLYSLGYLSTFEEDEVDRTLDAVFISQRGMKSYKIT